MASGRSQRHLREIQGVDSSGNGPGIAPPPVLVLPVYDDSYGTLNLSIDQLMTPVDLSAAWTGAASYDMDITPVGCAFDGGTGILTGTPTVAGITEHTIAGINADGFNVAAPFSIVVA
tara:strand:- start:2046 stop:2399 length:354 start_codon:yes stop_codon:yes gene_type:complete